MMRNNNRDGGHHQTHYGGGLRTGDGGSSGYRGAKPFGGNYGGPANPQFANKKPEEINLMLNPDWEEDDPEELSAQLAKIKAEREAAKANGFKTMVPPENHCDPKKANGVQSYVNGLNNIQQPIIREDAQWPVIDNPVKQFISAPQQTQTTSRPAQSSIQKTVQPTSQQMQPTAQPVQHPIQLQPQPTAQQMHYSNQLQKQPTQMQPHAVKQFLSQPSQASNQKLAQRMYQPNKKMHQSTQLPPSSDKLVQQKSIPEPVNVPPNSIQTIAQPILPMQQPLNSVQQPPIQPHSNFSPPVNGFVSAASVTTDSGIHVNGNGRCDVTSLTDGQRSTPVIFVQITPRGGVDITQENVMSPKVPNVTPQIVISSDKSVFDYFTNNNTVDGPTENNNTLFLKEDICSLANASQKMFEAYFEVNALFQRISTRLQQSAL